MFLVKNSKTLVTTMILFSAFSISTRAMAGDDQDPNGTGIPDPVTYANTSTGSEVKDKKVEIEVPKCSNLDNEVGDICLDGDVLSKVTKVKLGTKQLFGILGKKDKIKYKALTAKEKAQFYEDNGVTVSEKSSASEVERKGVKYKKCSSNCVSYKVKDSDDDSDDSDDDGTSKKKNRDKKTARKTGKDLYQDAQDHYVQVYSFCRGGDAEDYASDVEDQEDKKDDTTASDNLKDAKKALDEAKAKVATAQANSDKEESARNKACRNDCLNIALNNGYNYSACNVDPNSLCQVLKPADSSATGNTKLQEIIQNAGGVASQGSAGAACSANAINAQTTVNDEALCRKVFGQDGCLTQVWADKDHTVGCKADIEKWLAKRRLVDSANTDLASAQTEYDTANDALKKIKSAKLATKDCSIDYLTSEKAADGGYLKCTSKSIIRAADKCDRALADAQSDINTNLKYCVTCSAAGGTGGACNYGGCRGVSNTAQILGAILPSATQLGMGILNYSLQNRSLSACMATNSALITQGNNVGLPPQAIPCGVQNIMGGYNAAYNPLLSMTGYGGGYNPLAMTGYGGYNPLAMSGLSGYNGLNTYNPLNGGLNSGFNNMYNIYGTQQQQYAQLGAQNQVLAQTQMLGINPLGNAQYGNGLGYNNYAGFNQFNPYNTISPYASAINPYGAVIGNTGLNAGFNLNLNAGFNTGYNNYNAYNPLAYNAAAYNPLAYNPALYQQQQYYPQYQGTQQYYPQYQGAQQQYYPQYQQQQNGCSVVVIQVGGSC